MDAKQLSDLLQRFSFLGSTVYEISNGALAPLEEVTVYQTTRPCILNIEFSTNFAQGNLRIRPYRAGLAVITNGIRNDGTGTIIVTPSDLLVHGKRNVHIMGP